MKTCLLPWSHLFYSSDKNVYPCCKLASKGSEYVLGKSTDSVDKLWNSPVLKKLRMDFMNQNIPVACNEQCFNSINPLNVHASKEDFERKDQWYSETMADGTFRKNFLVWNLVASNLCNYKCAYCNIIFSSRFYEDKSTYSVLPPHLAKEMPTQRDYRCFDDKEQLLSLFKENMVEIERIYFAGGESHLQEGYYDMLDMLIKAGKTDIYIEFFTNMSGFEYKGRNILELLKHFPNAHVVGSLDLSGKRAEYIRFGTKWSEVEKNRVDMIKKYPEIKFILQPVVSNMSMYHLPDFHQDWFTKKLVRKDNIRYIPLEEPAEMHVSVMPIKLKEKVAEKYTGYLDFISSEPSTETNKVTPAEKIRSILKEMEKKPIKTDSEFNMFIYRLNMTRNNLRFKDVFPEFTVA